MAEMVPVAGFPCGLGSVKGGARYVESMALSHNLMGGTEMLYFGRNRPTDSQVPKSVLHKAGRTCGIRRTGPLISFHSMAAMVG